MLADVIKEREQKRIERLEAERSIYNKPYKRDTIIYFNHIHTIGGIETWIYNLGKRYEFSVVYDFADKEQIKRLEKIGVEAIKNVGQPIECNTLIFPVFNNPKFIKAKKRISFIHGMYDYIHDLAPIPEYDEIYAVSQGAAEAFYKTYGIKAKVLYNHIDIEQKEKPLILGVFSRLSKEKGKERVIYLLDKLKEKNKDFLMLIFTDLPFDYNDNRVIFIKPELNPFGWMSKCDYICQLSSTEAGCITAQESLKLGIPLIITKLPILEEFGINETNAKILEFDMSNLDIEDLWNIPKVNWQEPISKEWETIMKKRIFKEKKEKIEKEIKKKNKNKNKEVTQSGVDNFEKGNKKGTIFLEKAFSKKGNNKETKESDGE